MLGDVKRTRHNITLMYARGSLIQGMPKYRVMLYMKARNYIEMEPHNHISSPHDH
jgi:hypothetical protein